MTTPEGRIYSDGRRVFPQRRSAFPDALCPPTRFSWPGFWPTAGVLSPLQWGDHGGQGLLFVGHSEAGKSTTVKMLQGKAEILCDDRNIVRRWPEGFRVHGTWSHGEVPLVSAASAPLSAIFFLHKSKQNRLMRLRTAKRSSAG